MLGEHGSSLTPSGLLGNLSAASSEWPATSDQQVVELTAEGALGGSYALGVGGARVECLLLGCSPRVAPSGAQIPTSALG
jgi:hypothetical protein